MLQWQRFVSNQGTIQARAQWQFRDPYSLMDPEIDSMQYVS